jgi:hypothetical protein
MTAVVLPAHLVGQELFPVITMYEMGDVVKLI